MESVRPLSFASELLLRIQFLQGRGGGVNMNTISRRHWIICRRHLLWYSRRRMLRLPRDRPNVSIKLPSFCSLDVMAAYYWYDLRRNVSHPTGWPFSLWRTSRWLQNKSSVLAWMELLFWSQREVRHKLKGHPVGWDTFLCKSYQ